MPDDRNCLTERDHLTIELALCIEDPAGIEAIDLAAVIVEVFERRSARQCELMRQSLWRWAQQWPRTLSAVKAAEPPPPTQRNVCVVCKGSGQVIAVDDIDDVIPCPLCRSAQHAHKPDGG